MANETDTETYRQTLGELGELQGREERIVRATGLRTPQEHYSLNQLSKVHRGS